MPSKNDTNEPMTWDDVIAEIREFDTPGADDIADYLKANRERIEAGMRGTLRFERGIGLDCKPEWHWIGKDNQIVFSSTPAPGKTMEDAEKYLRTKMEDLGLTAEFVDEQSEQEETT